MKKRIFSLLLCLALLAAMPLSAFAHRCIDADGDYWCDICDWVIYHNCVDPDKDGWCNYCDCWIIHTCIDNDKDTFCDLCSELADINVHVTVESYVQPDWGVHMVIYFRQPIDTKSVKVWDNPAKYSFKCAAKSSFQLIVSKLKHPARTFSYNTSTEDIYIDTTLYPYGDATQDGKVNVADTSLIYACVKGTGRLADDYANECADVNYDHDLNIADVSKVYAHVKQTNFLW
jgi:hypothetical protein